jgi:hypothetical protein
MEQQFKIFYEQVYTIAKPFNYIEDAFVIFLAILSFLINIPLLIAISRMKWKSLKIDMKLGFLMIIFDLGAGIDTFINHFSNLIHSSWNLPTKWSCSLNAFICLFFFINSIILVGLVSIERCLLIVYKRAYSDKFYYTIAMIFCTLNAMISIVIPFYEGFNIVASSTYCLLDVSTIAGIAGSLLVGGLMGASLVCIFFGYTMIILYRSNQSKQAQLELGLDPEKVKKEVRSTVIKSLSIIFVSAITNGPYTVLLLLQMISSAFLTPAILAVSAILINCNTMLNSLILLNMKPELLNEVRKAYGFKTD